jgi:RNA polymerase sigma-70 factor (ECF subfamily)
MSADAFEAFVRSYQDMVYGIAVRLLGNPSDAEDVAQTVFLKAFQRFDEIGGSVTAGGWLRTVTRNMCLNHLTRYRARWRFFSEIDRPGDDGVTFEEGLIAPAAPAAELERGDERAYLERALQALPDHQRVPLVLYHFDELGYQEIADLIGVSLAKVKTDIHRGREALRRRLAHVHATR